ncbi:MAG TPA: glycosyltransferase [Anaeromyxobacteraceae bacterium]|nr:glycosyltransferase [Anaeromyxobacteraceae bacterium]
MEQARRALAVVAVAVSLYYLYWRQAETFNPAAPTFSWLLYGAEVFGFVTTVLFYFTVWRPRERTAPPPLPGRSVDVLVPTKNEPLAVLRTTLLACNDLRYPHRTLVLDDGARPEVEALCAELNCVYLARRSSEHAKAGNLNFGLAHSRAEFVALFDADHVPLPHFLDRLMGYFADDSVGFVQVPQEFYNVDSIQHRWDRKGKRIWAEQYLFFSVIQPGKDRWNAAFFVGSCAILRRTALEDIGGFPTGSITEDMLTSIRIHARGWASVYHREFLAYGIAAQTLAPFAIQRQRWGVGNWQVFAKANPLFLPGLSLPQRLCYLGSMIYPLEGLQKIIFYATPPIALVTGVLPMRALDAEYLLHFVPYFAISTWAFNEMARGVGGQVMLEQYSMAKYFTYLETLVIPLIPGKGKVFKVTPKARVVGASGLILPQLAVFFSSLAATVWALASLLLGRRSDGFIVAVNSFWALYNSGLAATIVGFGSAKVRQRRAEFRVPETVVASFRPAGDGSGAERFGVVEDLTPDGAGLVSVGQVPQGPIELSLLLPRAALRLRCRVVRCRSARIGNREALQLGLEFLDVPQDARDVLSRYLHEAAVSRFMKEHALGYQTWLERRLSRRDGLPDRAGRSLAYLPVLLRERAGQVSTAAMKDLSATGLLLVNARQRSPGERLGIEVVLGEERIALTGQVVRSSALPGEEYPEYLAGIRLDGECSQEARRLTEVASRIDELVHGEPRTE